MDAVIDTARASDAQAQRPTFYDFDGETWTPTKRCRSPWRPNAVNGMALAGVMAHAAEAAPAPGPMLPVRINIDILRPVPFAPFTTQVEMIRPGKKMQVFDVLLVSGGETYVRARVVRARETEGLAAAAPIAYPLPEAVVDAPRHFAPKDPMGELIETRMVAQATAYPSTGALWTRFADLAPGIASTGVVHTAMVSDFGGGVSRVADITKYTFANLDISIHLARRPVGEWQLVECTSLVQGAGVGLSNMVLADRLGQFGRAHQTLFIEKR
jgi:hypothetical protein